MGKNLVRREFSGDDTWVAPAGVSEVKVFAFRDNIPQLGTSSSGSHAITSANDLYGWGDNSSGQVGDNTTANRSSPALVVGGFKWVHASSINNSFFTGLVLNSDNTVSAYSFGSNGSGRLGDNTSANRSSPVAVVGGLNLRRNGGGGSGGVLVTTAGDAYCWNANNSTSGAVGDNTIVNRSSPVLVVGARKWKQVSGGDTHNAGIDSNGDAYCWGDNSTGAVGDSSTANRSSPTLVAGSRKWKKIYAGQNYTMGIDSSDNLYAWGGNTAGVLGDNTTVSKSSPVLVAGSKKFVHVAAGAISALAIDVNGDMYGWGDNSTAAIGDNTTANRSSPVLVVGSLKWAQASCGFGFAAAMTVGGALYGWGVNSSGQVGDNTTVNRSSPVLVAGTLSLSPAKDVLVNEDVMPVTPGTSYAVTVFSNYLKIDGLVSGFGYGSTKIVLEYYA